MTTTFVGVIIGVIVALIFYNSTVNSYKNAGAGNSYSLSQNGNVSFRVRDDTLVDTRHSINRGFYSNGSAGNIAAGGVGTVAAGKVIHHAASAARPTVSSMGNSRPHHASHARPSAGHARRPVGGPKGGHR